MNGRPTPPSPARTVAAGGAVLVAGMVAAAQLGGGPGAAETPAGDRGRVYSPPPPAQPSPTERDLLRLHGPHAGRGRPGAASVEFPHAGSSPAADAARAASVLQRLPLRRSGVELRLTGSVERPAVLVIHRTVRAVATRTWRSLVVRHGVPVAELRVVYRPVGRRALGSAGAAAVAAARACAGTYAAYSVGRAGDGAVTPVTRALAGELAGPRPRVLPDVRGATPRLESARLLGLAPSSAIASVAIDDLPLTERLTVRLQRAGDRWRCTRIGAAQ